MKIYWCGPTMGKTYAATSNPQIVDFDDVAREPFKQLANELGMSVKQMKTEMPKEFHELFVKLITTLSNIKEDKYVLVSNAIGLQYAHLFEVLLIPSVDAFIARNIERGGNAEESWKWYQCLMYEHGAYRRCIIEDRFVSELTKTLFK